MDYGVGARSYGPALAAAYGAGVTVFGVEPQPGWVSDELRAEFPELRLWQVEVAAVPRPSSRSMRERMRHLSDRFRPADPFLSGRGRVQQAYRACYRHLGLDPDVTRTPADTAAVEAVLHGELATRSLLDDALLITVVETGVPVWAADSRRLEGGLGLRVAAAGERLGPRRRSPQVPAGRLVVADRTGALAELFGDLGPRYRVRRSTRRMTLYAVQVADVVDVDVTSAVWSCAELLS